MEALASASDNLPDAFRTVGPHLRENPGADVLVVGGIGRIPLYAAGLARALGAGRVDYLDVDPGRLRIAEALGARAIESPPPKRADTYAITVDGSRDPAGLACALRSLEPNGVCTSLGIYFAETPLPLLDMYTRGVRFFTGRVNARAEIPHVLERVASRRFHPELVTSEVVPWHEAAEALARPTLKPVFVRPS
ncbi:MAG TPA: L-threonine 3-dehydrogenase [Myxococcota bacterium]|nr:L-threonine 3-dehydrogenase [Myxococcota bacterium]